MAPADRVQDSLAREVFGEHAGVRSVSRNVVGTGLHAQLVALCPRIPYVSGRLLRLMSLCADSADRVNLARVWDIDHDSDFLEIRGLIVEGGVLIAAPLEGS